MSWHLTLLVDPMMMPPSDPANLVQAEVWKSQLHTYNVQLTFHVEAEKQAYAVVLGQCSQGVRD